MKKTIIALIVFCLVGYSLAAERYTYKVNQKTGKEDLVTHYDNYSSLTKIGTGGNGDPTWKGGAWPGAIQGQYTSLATTTSKGLMSAGDKQTINALPVYVDEYSPVADGTKHLISSQYTLSAAQAKWPNAGITSGNVGVWTIDDAAIQEAYYHASQSKSELVFGGKSYFLSTGIVNTASIRIKGQGQWNTTLNTDYNGILIDNPNDMAVIEDLGIVVSSGNPGVNQIGINFGNNSAQIRGGQVNRIYTKWNRIAINLNSLTGGGINSSYIHLSKLYGLEINNNYNTDQGDNGISNCVFTDIDFVSTAHIHVTKGSGIRITNSKIIHGQQGLVVDAPVVKPPSTNWESVLEIFGTSFENQSVGAIKVRYADSADKFRRILIDGNEIAPFHYGTAYGIDLDNTEQVTITSNVFDNGSKAIKIANSIDVVVTDNLINSWTTGIEIDSTVSGGYIGPNYFGNIVTTKVVNNSSTVKEVVDSDLNVSPEIISTSSSANRGRKNTQISTDTNGAFDIFKKSRGTPQSLSAIVNGDIINGVHGEGYDGSAYQRSATWNFSTDGAVSAGVVPIRYQLATGSSAGNKATRFVVKSTGETMLGPTVNADDTPLADLDVRGAFRASSTVESASGGFKFPDATVQTTAAPGYLSVWANVPSGGGGSTSYDNLTGTSQFKQYTGIYSSGYFSLSGNTRAINSSLVVWNASSGELVINGATINGSSSYTLPVGNNIVSMVKVSSTDWKIQWSTNGTTPGAVGASGNVAYNNGGVMAGASQLNYDTANSRVGIRTATPAVALEIAQDVSVAGTAQFWTGHLNGSANILNVGLRVARGTSAAPRRVSSGDALGGVFFRGAYAADDTSSATFEGGRRAGLLAYATESHTAAGQGARLSFETTPTGTASPTERMAIMDNGHIEYSGTAPTVSSCGTSPSIVGNDTTGTITAGSGVVTSCTLNFASAWTNAPNCFPVGNSLVTFDVSAKSTTAVTFSSSATVAGGTIDYYCVGRR